MEPDPPSKTPSLRWQIAFPAILSLISALLGAIAGAQIAASSSEEIKYDEFQEQRAEEARALRIVAYEEFLDSSDQLDDARITLWNCYHVSPVGITQPESGESKIHRCGEERDVADKIVQAIAAKIDGLLIYGTEGATSLAWRILKEYALRSPETGEWIADVPIDRQLPFPYEDLRIQFQRQVCEDVNPLPRADC